MGEWEGGRVEREGKDVKGWSGWEWVGVGGSGWVGWVGWVGELVDGNFTLLLRPFDEKAL